jgi:hypothetical protein
MNCVRFLYLCDFLRQIVNLLILDLVFIRTGFLNFCFRFSLLIFMGFYFLLWNLLMKFLYFFILFWIFRLLNILRLITRRTTILLKNLLWTLWLTFRLVLHLTEIFVRDHSHEIEKCSRILMKYIFIYKRFSHKKH